MEKTQSEDITEFIKLGKNSRGYTWEIKVYGLSVDKLEKINKELQEKFYEETK